MSEYKRVPVKGYEGEYEVDTLGNVYSLKTNIKLKPNDSKNPYYTVHLLHNGVRKARTIHRIVAEAFIPNPRNLPQVNHKDEDKHNNNADNLEWCTALYNSRYGTAIERAKRSRKPVTHTEEEKKHLSEVATKYWATHRHPLKKIDILCVNDRKVFHSYSEVQSEYGIERHKVKKMCENGFTVNGLSFRYIQMEIVE